MGTAKEILHQNGTNSALQKAIQDIKHIDPDLPLEERTAR